MLSKTAFTTLFVAVTFGFGFSQTMAAEPVPRTQLVRYADLDLSTTAGAETLLKRIRRAADAVCGRDEWYAATSPSFRACVEEASSRAVAHVGNPTVTAMFNGSGMQLAKK